MQFFVTTRTSESVYQIMKQRRIGHAEFIHVQWLDRYFQTGLPWRDNGVPRSGRAAGSLARVCAPRGASPSPPRHTMNRCATLIRGSCAIVSVTSAQRHEKQVSALHSATFIFALIFFCATLSFDKENLF